VEQFHLPAAPWLLSTRSNRPLTDVVEKRAPDIGRARPEIVHELARRTYSNVPQ
jgi:hypothetical protein